MDYVLGWGSFVRHRSLYGVVWRCLWLSEWLDAAILLVILDEGLLSVFELVGLDCVLECFMVGLLPRGAGWLVFEHRTWCYWTIRSHFTGIRNSLSLPGLLSVFELVGLDCVWVGLGPREAGWLVFEHRTWCYWTIRSHFTGIRNSLSLLGLLSVFELVGLDFVWVGMGAGGRMVGVWAQNLVLLDYPFPFYWDMESSFVTRFVECVWVGWFRLRFRVCLSWLV